MTTIATHPHVEFDRYPQLLRSVTEEFGREDAVGRADKFIEAEHADFHWDARIAERNLGAWESFEEEDVAFERVAIIGFLRGRYYVATCIVDEERHVHGMLGLRHANGFDAAVALFSTHGT